ncbi:hypothetical protein HNP46_004182 [Pseudomonas nitritireducens]|uniref:Uncharacterized protein n=1 Tax=Pseudomonas nitroreducens TaxID=46680 RepID=A0A7W7KM31_PSENT|nr:hypothetical protein [Pseudomonas nitritireducens]MBB4865301.1 hypothetical protein [Pseudomonas nitritireducens]
MNRRITTSWNELRAAVEAMGARAPLALVERVEQFEQLLVEDGAMDGWPGYEPLTVDALTTYLKQIGFSVFAGLGVLVEELNAEGRSYATGIKGGCYVFTLNAGKLDVDVAIPPLPCTPSIMVSLKQKTLDQLDARYLRRPELTSSH